LIFIVDIIIEKVSYRHHWSHIRLTILSYFRESASWETIPSEEDTCSLWMWNRANNKGSEHNETVEAV